MLVMRSSPPSQFEKDQCFARYVASRNRKMNDGEMEPWPMIEDSRFKNTFKPGSFNIRIIDAHNGFVVSLGQPVRLHHEVGVAPTDVFVAHTPESLGQLIKELAERVER